MAGFIYCFFFFLLQALNSCQHNTDIFACVKLSGQLSSCNDLSLYYDGVDIQSIWSWVVGLLVGTNTSCSHRKQHRVCTCEPSNIPGLERLLLAESFASPQRSGSVSDVEVARPRMFASTNHFPKCVCAVIERTGLQVEIIMEKLDQGKIRLSLISIQCYLFWKSDDKWIWFFMPVQAG